MTDQLALFDVQIRAPGARPCTATTNAKGPRGLLLALIEAGLREDALEPAAAIVLLMDSEPMGDEAHD
jgi:hypothetical protein